MDIVKATVGNGNLYEGEWHDGCPNGYGTMKYSTGSIYSGQWLDGKRNGQGSMSFSTGDTYIGDWAGDQKNGHGVYIFKSGDKYEGVFENNKYHGSGTYYYKNGERYEGQWLNDKKTGYGVYTFPNGEKYEGNFENSKYHGYGTLIYANGDSHSGQWSNGIKSGYGVYTFKNGDKYEGMYADGKRHGNGIYTFLSGERRKSYYQYGNLINEEVMPRDYPKTAGPVPVAATTPVPVTDKNTGTPGTDYSRKEFSNGSVYEGEFLNGKMHGQGKYTWPSGDSYEGGFADGAFEGYGVYTHASGSRYEGAHHNDKRHGEGILYHASGEIEKVVYENGTLVEREPMTIGKISFSELSSWSDVKSIAHKETEKKREILETIALLRNPKDFSNPNHREISEACMYLRPFLSEAQELFLKRDEIKAAEILGMILGVEFSGSEKWINSDTIKYFTQFVSAALHTVYEMVDLSTADPYRYIVPTANIAYYVFCTFDVNLFHQVTDLMAECGKSDDADYLWFKRMEENDNCTMPCSEEYSYWKELDIYKMGSDCRLFDPARPKADIY